MQQSNTFIKTEALHKPNEKIDNSVVSFLDTTYQLKLKVILAHKIKISINLLTEILVHVLRSGSLSSLLTYPFRQRLHLTKKTHTQQTYQK